MEATTACRPRKVYTLILPLDVPNRRVLLGHKKRGFGVGKYNGFGGKVEPGETKLQGAIRELEEEAHLVCKPDGMHHHAVLLMETHADPDAAILEIHVYIATAWAGEPRELSEEMRPEWFAALPRSSQSDDGSYDGLRPLPVDDMWEETRGWMPILLGLYFDPTVAADDVTGRKEGDRYFIHHVTFCGGKNPQTGLEDVWHGMSKSWFAWYKGSIDHWDGLMLGNWLAQARWK